MNSDIQIVTLMCFLIPLFSIADEISPGSGENKGETQGFKKRVAHLSPEMIKQLKDQFPHFQNSPFAPSKATPIIRLNLNAAATPPAEPLAKPNEENLAGPATHSTVRAVEDGSTLYGTDLNELGEWSEEFSYVNTHTAKGAETNTYAHQILYGLTPDGTISITIPKTFSHDPETGNSNGMGNMVLGLLYRLAETADRKGRVFELAILSEFGLRSSTAAETTGNASPGHFFHTGLTEKYSFNDSWAILGNLGHTFNFFQAPGQNDAGIAIIKQFDSKFAASIQYNVDDLSSRGWHYVGVGVNYKVNKNYGLSLQLQQSVKKPVGADHQKIITLSLNRTW